ncbi:MAG: hypothetical protein O2789_02855 [Actinomycetota bacterium]|nr:hypothetical protein [Actinomycetota bacterium]
MLDLLITAAFWSTAIAGAVPIAFAALGALLASRAGVLFIGVEAALLSSTFGALAVALTTGSTLAGVVGGAVVGSITALLFAFLSMSLGMGDVVAGIILLILTIGVTGFLLSDWFPQGLTIGADLMGPSWPATGNATLDLFLHQPILVYVCVLAAIAIGLFLKSRLGLQVRASGDSLRVSYSIGIRLVPLRYAVLAVAGALTGLGGAFLGLAVIGSYSTTVTSGRGWIALACVILAAWRPLAAIVAALLFSCAYTFGFQVDTDLGVVQLLPYVLTLVVIATFKGARGPAEEGRGLEGGAR